MKNLTLLLTALVMSVTVMANTNIEPFPASKATVALVQSQDLLKLYFQSPDESKIKIKIYNEEGDMIASQSIAKTNGFILPFNFEKLDYGMYTFEITDANGTLVESVNYQPIIKEGVKASLYKVDKSGRVRLSVVLNNDDAAVVKIFDAYSNLLHQETASKAFSRVYDLSKLSDGAYFRISDNNKTVGFSIDN